MKIKIRLILLIAVYFVLLSARGQGIKFEEKLSWEQVKAKALAEHKNIFIDFYTTWCLPCKAMDETVYPIKEVGDFFNDKFVSIRVQVDSTAKDNNYVKSWRTTSSVFQKQYPISAYPTMFFVNASGFPLMKVTGLQTAEGLVKTAEVALDSNSSYIGLYRQFLAGRKDSEFILRMITTGKSLGQQEQVDEIGKDYISKLSENDLFMPNNLLIIDNIKKKTNDRGFKVFMKYPQKVVESLPEKFTLEYLNLSIGSVIYDELITPNLKTLHGGPDWMKIKSNVKSFGEIGQDMLLRAEYSDAVSKMIRKTEKSPKYKLHPILEKSKSWSEVLLKIKALNLGRAEEFWIGSSIIYYMSNIAGNFDNFFQATNYYERQFNVLLGAQALNDWAWVTFENISDTNLLGKALIWSEKSLKMSPGQVNFMDTYANILYKLGRKAEAIQWEEKATAAQPDNADFELTLQRMKENEQTWPAR